MTNDSFRYAFKVIGFERKRTASILAEVLGLEATYAGVPTYAYKVGGWTIDREGVLISPDIAVEQKSSLRQILDALKEAGASTEGNGTVSLPLEGHTSNSVKNLVNLIFSKQTLLKKALDRQTNIIPEGLVKIVNAAPIESMDAPLEIADDGSFAESELNFNFADKTIQCAFSNAALDANEVLAFVTLCQQLSEQAKKQKFTSAKQREAGENEKYGMRCFLLKLGFIGADFKTERKTLLARLDGDGAYAKPEAKQAAEAKRKAKALAEGTENKREV